MSQADSVIDVQPERIENLPALAKLNEVIASPTQNKIYRTWKSAIDAILWTETQLPRMKMDEIQAEFVIASDEWEKGSSVGGES